MTTHPCAGYYISIKSHSGFFSLRGMGENQISLALRKDGRIYEQQSPVSAPAASAAAVPAAAAVSAAAASAAAVPAAAAVSAAAADVPAEHETA